MDEPTSACGHRNRPGARFCSECGTALPAGCPACGSEPRPGARFCDACGAPLAAGPALSPAPESERKQVTVLFADVAGSMDLAERLDADEWTQIMKRLFALFRAAITEFGGTVDKFTGDGAMALFGAPLAQEDHARRACHAALRLVSATDAYAVELRDRGITLDVRVGLNSGEVVAGSVAADGSAYTAVGHTVGLAQRMESLAEPGVPRLSGHTAALVPDGFVLRGLGRVPVKGATEPVEVFALHGAAGGSAGASRRRSGSARLVGRDSELATLAAALSGAQDGRAQVVGIVGEAGAGKSRLCDELARRATEIGVTVRRTAGVSHAQSVPLLPIIGLLRNYFGVTPDDSPGEIRRKAGDRLMGLDPQFESELGLIFDFLEAADPERPPPQLAPEGRQRRVLDVLRRATQRRSERQTLVLILEDLHWFDRQSVAFLEAWIPTFPGTRTLVVTNFRPEFHAPWMGHSFYRQVPLSPLDDPAVAALLGELLGPAAGMRELTAQLLPRAGGNPFFAEEIVRGLAGDDTLTGEPGAYALARSASEVRVPATVQAVLAARIDRLPIAEKTTLQAAAVIGRTFTDSVVAAVLDCSTEALADALQSLRGAELLQSTDEAGEYRFWHPLTQEVAYATLLGAARRRLHQRVARALMETAAQQHDEIAALVATHFDAAGDDLEAARWQARAAARALRGDLAEAQRRLYSALDHLAAVPESDEVLRIEVMARQMLLRVGGRTGMDPQEAEEIVAVARRQAQALDDPVLLAILAGGEMAACFFTGDARSGMGFTAEMRLQAERSGDRAVQAWAYCTGGIAYGYVGPICEALRQLEHGIELCGDDPWTGVDHCGYSVHDYGHFIRVLSLIAGGRLEEARVRALHTLELFELRPVVDWLVWTLTYFAHIADCTGDPAQRTEAAAMAEEAERRIGETNSVVMRVKARHAAGLAALLEGRPDAALTILGEALATARAHRSGLIDEASLLAHLARSRLELGDRTGARAAADQALEVVRRQGTAVVEGMVQAVRARVWRQTASNEADLDVAREAVAEGKVVAAKAEAASYSAMLAEEAARLDGTTVALLAAAQGYDAIGATGHAARIRAELGS